MRRIYVECDMNRSLDIMHTVTHVDDGEPFDVPMYLRNFQTSPQILNADLLAAVTINTRRYTYSHNYFSCSARSRLFSVVSCQITVTRLQSVENLFQSSKLWIILMHHAWNWDLHKIADSTWLDKTRKAREEARKKQPPNCSSRFFNYSSSSRMFHVIFSSYVARSMFIFGFGSFCLLLLAYTHFHLLWNLPRTHEQTKRNWGIHLTLL